MKLRWRNLMYNSSIIIATHMSYNYFPCVKGMSINNIRKYLPIFRATLITVCCLCSYICTVVFEAGNRVWCAGHWIWYTYRTRSKDHLGSLFSSPEPKAQVRYCHSAPSVVRLSGVRSSSVCKLLHFQLLLQNRLMDFDETW